MPMLTRKMKGMTQESINSIMTAQASSTARRDVNGLLMLAQAL